MKKTSLIKRISLIILCIYLLIPTFLIYVLAEEYNEQQYKEKLQRDGFPESYTQPLYEIHKRHNNWIFTPVDTEKDFFEAVKEESADGKSTLYTNQGIIPLMLSKDESKYNPSTGEYEYSYVDGSAVNAMDFEIAYYMDPRNFISEETAIFQFEDLSFPDYASKEDLLKSINSILSNSFAKNDVELFYNSGRTYNVNPCFMASKAIQEHGREGAGYKGDIDGVTYYNYFNIGAYADSGSGTNVANAISYAKSHGWDSREKAINGGAAFMSGSENKKSGYISKGQNTNYFMKFNVNPAANQYHANYTHQYSSSIYAPHSESITVFNSYNVALSDAHDGENNTTLLDAPKYFEIPVYDNMPKYDSSKVLFDDSARSGTTVMTTGFRTNPGPDYDLLPKPYVDKGTKITIEGMRRSDIPSSRRSNHYKTQLKYGLWYYVPSRDAYTAYENLELPITKTLKTGEACTLGYSNPSGTDVRFDTADIKIASVNPTTGEVYAKSPGITQIIIYTAGGSLDYINLSVTQGDVPSNLTSSVFKIDESNLTVSGIKVGTSVEDLLSALNEKSFASVFDGNHLVTSGNLKTGMTVRIVSGQYVGKAYKIAVRGDTNGDGKIKTGDAVKVLQYIAGSGSLEGVFKIAGDTNRDGYVKTGDAVTILKQIS